MKKFISVAILSSLVSMFALADDFLAKITNGTVSDNSLGVKKLSYEKMKEIKGGYNISNPVLFQNANSGFGGFIAQIGVVILPDIDNEVSNGVMCGYGYLTCSSYTNKQGFNEFVDIADPRQHQYLAITATKTISVGAFGIPQYTFSNSGIVVDLNSNGSVYKIRNAAIKGYVANDVSIKS